MIRAKPRKYINSLLRLKKKPFNVKKIKKKKNIKIAVILKTEEEIKLEKEFQKNLIEQRNRKYIQDNFIFPSLKDNQLEERTYLQTMIAIDAIVKQHNGLD